MGGIFFKDIIYREGGRREKRLNNTQGHIARPSREYQSGRLERKKKNNRSIPKDNRRIARSSREIDMYACCPLAVRALCPCQRYCTLYICDPQTSLHMYIHSAGSIFFYHLTYYTHFRTPTYSTQKHVGSSTFLFK
jgi:hypothetical protein